MRPSLILQLGVAATVMLSSCSGDPDRPSSNSVEHARKRGVLVAEYLIPGDAKLEEYWLLEVWIETSEDPGDSQLIVRLKGPHVDIEPRVHVDGLTRDQYRAVWSERNGPPYEVWALSNLPPSVLVLRRSEHVVELRRIDGR